MKKVKSNLSKIKIQLEKFSKTLASAPQSEKADQLKIKIATVSKKYKKVLKSLISSQTGDCDKVFSKLKGICLSTPSKIIFGNIDQISASNAKLNIDVDIKEYPTNEIIKIISLVRSHYYKANECYYSYELGLRNPKILKINKNNRYFLSLQEKHCL